MKTKQNNPTRIFRTVECSERLPEMEGRYPVLNHGQWHEANYCKEYSFHEEMTNCAGVTHWMEEVELPSDEEIKKESDKGWVRSHFQAGASFILNHIKGGGE